MRLRSLAFLATIVAAGTAGAQGMSPAAPVQWRSFVGGNPLAIPFDIFAVEGETVVGTGTTLGAVIAYNDINDTRYSTLESRVKYYPGELALRGFAIGLSLGYTKFNGILSTQPGGFTQTQRGTLSAPTLGVLADYNWTPGPAQHFVVGTGVSAKRILASAPDRDAIGLERAYVTARFVIGVLF